MPCRNQALLIPILSQGPEPGRFDVLMIRRRPRRAQSYARAAQRNEFSTRNPAFSNSPPKKQKATSEPWAEARGPPEPGREAGARKHLRADGTCFHQPHNICHRSPIPRPCATSARRLPPAALFVSARRWYATRLRLTPGDRGRSALSCRCDRSRQDGRATANAACRAGSTRRALSCAGRCPRRSSLRSPYR